MVCARCGLVQPETANYCMHCGAGLPGQSGRSAWGRAIIVVVAVIVLALLFFTAFPQPGSGPSRVPAAAAATDLPMIICASDPDWVRPTPEEMAATIWQDNRYRDIESCPNPAAQAYYAAHIFVVPLVTASGTAHLIDMAGFGTARLLTGAACWREPPRNAALDSGQEVELWLIGYTAVAAQGTDRAAIEVTVRPHASLDQGYQIVRVARPDPTTLALRVVRTDGEVVADVAGRQLFGPVDVVGWPPRGR